MAELEKRALGGTGIQVSCLGLGSVKIGRNQAVKYPADFSLPADHEVQRLLDTARELGINLLDTAPAYGASEDRLGRLLGRRDDWVISTKVGEEFQHGQSIFDFGARHTRMSVERSLRRLRTDYLDLVLVHSNGADEEIIRDGECLAALEELRQAGHLRAFGMSTKTVAGGLLAVACMDVVMVTYNPFQDAEAPVIDAAQAAGKGVLIKKALASGHLEKAGPTADPVEDSLRFIFARQGISSVVLGTLNPQHLRHNVEAAMRALG